MFNVEILHLPQMLKWIRRKLKSEQVPKSIQKKGGKIFLDLNVEARKTELVIVD